MNMKQGLLILGIILFYGVPRCSTAEDASSAYRLSLEDAITVAYKNNRDIQIEAQEIMAAQAGIEGARSEFLPKVSANAGYDHVDSILSLPGSQSTKKDAGVFTGYRNDNKAGLTLEQTIYNGGANASYLKQKQIQLSIQMETLRSRKLATEFEVKRLYYGLLLARATERIAHNLFDQAKAHYGEVKNKYEQGTASRFDCLQSSVQVSKLEPELIKAKNAVDLIDAELKKILGLKLQDTVTLKDDLTYTPIEIREDEFLTAAYSDKPEMKLMALGVDINAWAIKTAGAGDKPQVSAHLGTTYRSNDPADMVNSRHNNWQAGISVTVPIFDGFSTRAKVEEAKARYAQAELRKENAREQVAVEIRKACLDLQKALSMINSQKDGVGEAKEALKIAEVRFDNGEGTNLDVLDAQVSLGQVEKNLSEGMYEYLMAEAYLNLIMGRSRVAPGQERWSGIPEKGGSNERSY